MTPILYTDSDAVRAALGVSETEISDALVVNMQIADLLFIELQTVYPDHVALKAAIDSASPTAAQTNLFMKLRLFCQYEAIVCLLPSVQFWSVQRVSDGDAEMHRFMAGDLDKTIDRFTGMRDKYRTLLNPTLYPDSGLAGVLFRSISPGRDIIQEP